MLVAIVSGLHEDLHGQCRKEDDHACNEVGNRFMDYARCCAAFRIGLRVRLSVSDRRVAIAHVSRTWN
jgi:hypothetical protein